MGAITCTWVAANLNLSAEEKEFWQQPDGEGYRPCLDFSLAYRKASARISKEKRKFLVMVVSGGLNQQRNQIVDAVVIARILEAALVVPVLQVTYINTFEIHLMPIQCTTMKGQSLDMRVLFSAKVSGKVKLDIISRTVSLLLTVAHELKERCARRYYAISFDVVTETLQ
ncbi:UNVERIFIED_CONTAM: O-fucosyltransferase 37 [Sesamum calycinum]|uniref:O-fucosyltransferase family protein n=1 Tax=Sesamum calycinum TaxID=2727403 RepID=A0AAW2JDI7_9LAMI